MGEAEAGAVDAILRAADRAPAPAHLEFPYGFDHPRALARVRALVDRLQTAFDCRCPADTGVQDASFHATVCVPAEATGAGERIVVRLSNFGDLAVASADFPGCYGDLDEAEEAGALTSADRRTVEEAARSLGYVLIPESALRRPYDGVTRMAEWALRGEVTWWTRFFDYL
ncbi:hypothetical protein [Streptomyces bikiniensis]|uniref:hypothetical protein n=1 Tax=Streptomyces bikiniensis TaxID=1896 RepID=UPI0004C06B17|nr:hypothetical protein [Streptomyces bikiniensis]